MLKVYECLIDDGKNIFKENLATSSKKQMLNEYGGNGEFKKITDVTENFKIDLEKLENVLYNANYGITEIRIIKTALEMQNMNI